MNEYAKSPPILRAGYISTTEAAARLGVTPDTVRRWLKKGVLTGRRFGKKLFRVDADSVAEVAEGEPFYEDA